MTHLTLSWVTVGSRELGEVPLRDRNPAATADPSLIPSPCEFDAAAVQTPSPLPGRLISEAIQRMRDTFHKSRKGEQIWSTDEWVDAPWVKGW